MAAVQKVSEAQGLMVVISKLSELTVLIVESRCTINPLALCMKFCLYVIIYKHGDNANIKQ